MPQLPAIGQEVPQFDPTKPFTVVPPFGLSKLPAIGEEVPQFDPTKPFAAADLVPDFRTTNNPPSTALKAEAFGRSALQAALDALPGGGAIVGGALATPETVGAGTLGGAALGAGAGRGLRDLVSQGLGLERPTSPAEKGGAIALDVGQTYLAGKVLPWLWEVITSPGATVGAVFDRAKIMYKILPRHLKGFLPDFDALATLPKGVEKAPAAILERPAWQTWQQHLPDASPSPQVARSTGTSMIPAAMPPPATVAGSLDRPPAMAARAPTLPVAMPAAAPVRAMPNQVVINRLGLAARRAKLDLTLDEVKALVPLVEQGATPEQVIGKVVATRAATSPAAASMRASG